MNPLTRHVDRQEDPEDVVRWYWVTDGRQALVLMKSDAVGREDSMSRWSPRENLSWHLEYAGDAECKFLPAGRCGISTFGLLGPVLSLPGIVATFGEPEELEQPETFWAELERLFVLHREGRFS